MYKTTNFIPLKTHTDVKANEKRDSFSPKSSSNPLKSVYKHVEKSQYSRIIYIDKKEK
ncbi:MAG: hypothetical protein IJO27_02645 [Bacilli bacterium]|nr:hypothetical protein [Bacilli bacterium]